MNPPPAPELPGPDELRRMEELAVAHVRQVAGELVRPSFGGAPSEHHWASHAQVHTVDDAVAGAALHDLFAHSFPGHGLIIEDRPSIAGEGRFEWLIDPIDGSANHLRGIPYVAVSAGLRCDGVPVVGVVHDLLRDLTGSAHRGGGARLRGATGPAATLAVAGTATLDQAMLIAHLSRRGPLVNIPGVLQSMLWNIRKIRCMGSIALDLLLVASGEADLLVVGRGGPQRMLDIFGGLVLLEEAGGTVITADGRPVSESTRTLVAGSPRLVREFVALMADFDLEGWRSEQARPPR